MKKSKGDDVRGVGDEGIDSRPQANGDKVAKVEEAEITQDGSVSASTGSGSLVAKARLMQISDAQHEQAKSTAKYVHRLQEQIYGNFWSVSPLRWATITGNLYTLSNIRRLNAVHGEGMLEDADFLDLLHIVDEDGMNCLHLAANRGQCLEMTQLLQHRELLCKNLPSMKEKIRTTAKFRSLQSLQREVDFEDVLSFFVSIPGIDLNAADKKGNTPLLLASYCGHLKAVEILVQVTANMEILNKEGLNCLHAAASNGHTSVVERIVQEAGQMDMKFLNVKSGGDHMWTALHYAVANDRINVLELLLGYPDIAVDVQDNEGCTPLLLASTLGYVPAVKLLLRKGADKTIKNEKALNSLHVAASCGHIDVLKELRDASSSAFSAENVICYKPPTPEASIGVAPVFQDCIDATVSKPPAPQASVGVGPAFKDCNVAKVLKTPAPESSIGVVPAFKDCSDATVSESVSETSSRCSAPPPEVDHDGLSHRVQTAYGFRRNDEILQSPAKLTMGSELSKVPQCCR